MLGLSVRAQAQHRCTLKAERGDYSPLFDTRRPNLEYCLQFWAALHGLTPQAYRSLSYSWHSLPNSAWVPSLSQSHTYTSGQFSSTLHSILLWFHWLCISSLHFSLILTQPCWSSPDFLHVWTESSCDLRKTSSKLCFASLNLRALSQGIPFSDASSNWKFMFVKFRVLSLLSTWPSPLNSAWVPTGHHQCNPGWHQSGHH